MSREKRIRKKGKTKGEIEGRERRKVEEVAEHLNVAKKISRDVERRQKDGIPGETLQNLVIGVSAWPRR